MGEYAQQDPRICRVGRFGRTKYQISNQPLLCRFFLLRFKSLQQRIAFFSSGGEAKQAVVSRTQHPPTQTKEITSGRHMPVAHQITASTTTDRTAQQRHNNEVGFCTSYMRSREQKPGTYVARGSIVDDCQLVVMPGGIRRFRAHTWYYQPITCDSASAGWTERGRAPYLAYSDTPPTHASGHSPLRCVSWRGGGDEGRGLWWRVRVGALCVWQWVRRDIHPKISIQTKLVHPTDK